MSVTAATNLKQGARRFLRVALDRLETRPLSPLFSSENARFDELFEVVTHCWLRLPDSAWQVAGTLFAARGDQTDEL